MRPEAGSRLFGRRRPLPCWFRLRLPRHAFAHLPLPLLQILHHVFSIISLLLSSGPRCPALLMPRRARNGHLSQYLRFGVVMAGSELTSAALEGEMMYMICFEPLRTTRPLAATMYVSASASPPANTPP